MVGSARSRTLSAYDGTRGERIGDGRQPAGPAG